MHAGTPVNHIVGIEKEEEEKSKNTHVSMLSQLLLTSWKFHTIFLFTSYHPELSYIDTLRYKRS